MIDWWEVMVNGLWIAGLAVFLAAFSYHSAAKARGQASMHLLWSGEIWPTLGLAFFCLGLALASSETWKRVVWLVLMALAVSQSFISRRLERKKQARGETIDR